MVGEVKYEKSFFIFRLQVQNHMAGEVMMRSIPFSLKEESYESQRTAGRYHPASVAVWRDRTGKHAAVISAGGRDDVYMFREGTDIFCLALNTGLQYAGLEVFNEQTGKFEEGMFLQADYEVEEILGRNGIDKSPIWIARVMASYS